ncbi:unnamed protein product [Echinostoma caproni]|uniref:NLPC_P60 domain-containing protein n=1 Tax=Echinostoma caproni TaxID=27848 RepID=A0A183B0U3_9TREM|nr:unnamed protein product [Echinostoma caproni]
MNRCTIDTVYANQLYHSVYLTPDYVAREIPNHGTKCDLAVFIYHPPRQIMYAEEDNLVTCFLHASVVVIYGDRVEQVDKFCYLGSYISPGGCITDDASARVHKTRLAFANLRHLWRCRDIRLPVKGRVYTAAIRSVLL